VLELGKWFHTFITISVKKFLRVG